MRAEELEEVAEETGIYDAEELARRFERATGHRLESAEKIWAYITRNQRKPPKKA